MQKSSRSDRYGIIMAHGQASLQVCNGPVEWARATDRTVCETAHAIMVRQDTLTISGIVLELACLCHSAAGPGCLGLLLQCCAEEKIWQAPDVHMTQYVAAAASAHVPSTCMMQIP